MAILKTNDQYYILTIALLGLIAFGGSFKTRLVRMLSTFIPSVEGFRSTPYWDESRYSWGYGTAAPGATGSITREKAFDEMIAYLLNDYDTLSKMVARPLSVNQWAAWLSFSYNEGLGNADNLLTNIESGDNEALAVQWRKYIYAGGQINEDLIQRREKELKLWFS